MYGITPFQRTSLVEPEFSTHARFNPVRSRPSWTRLTETACTVYFPHGYTPIQLHLRNIHSRRWVLIKLPSHNLLVLLEHEDGYGVL